MPRRARRACTAALAATATLCAGCTWFSGQQEVLVTSEPAGARIFLDGTDTGQTTPHTFVIAYNFATDHVLELRRDGYRPERRLLTQHTEGYTSRWIDGFAEPGTPPLPLFWTPGDWFFPFGVKGAIVPGEVFVKLYREDEPLLGFALLAARAREQQMAEQQSSEQQAAPEQVTPPATAPDATPGTGPDGDRQP